MQDKPLIDPGQGKVISLEKETQFAPNGIVSRTVLTTPVCRVVLFGFDAGQELSEHTSTRRALVQILSGECEFTLGRDRHMLKAGDYLSMPPGQVHAVKAVQSLSMLLTLVDPE